MPTLLQVGTIEGTLDDVMYGSVTFTAADTLIKAIYTSNEIVDADTLYEIQGPTNDEPFRFLGLKWAVKATSPAVKAFVWPRDLVYLEATGILDRQGGERVGYHLMHSLDLGKGFDSLEGKRIVRGRVSSCYLYRQTAPNTVEVYMKTNFEPNGPIQSKSDAAIPVASDRPTWDLDSDAEEEDDYDRSVVSSRALSLDPECAGTVDEALPEAVVHGKKPASSANDALAAPWKKQRTQRQEWIPRYELELGLRPGSTRTPDGRIADAMCKFCVAFGREDDEVSQQQSADLSSKPKRKKTAIAKVFTSFRRDNIMKHMREQHPQRWREFAALPLDISEHSEFFSQSKTIVPLVAMAPRSTQPQLVARLRELLTRDEIALMPCCFDGLTAKLIERAGFQVAFMTGFGVSAVHVRVQCGFKLLSFGEMVRSAATICESLRNVPCIGDGDTGYGNAMNVKRTVAAYAQAGMAGIMLEDQVAPKRCGHTAGKAVVSREEAFARVRAAVDARKEGGFDIVIMARTDSRGTHSLDEAIARCLGFKGLGADITFLEAPQSVEEMEKYCREVPGPKMANMVENGLTPVLLPEHLSKMGYSLAAYPITLLSAGIKAMEEALQLLKCQTATDASDGEAEGGRNATPSAALDNLLCDFGHVKDVVGFTEYYAEEARYKQ
ncbi:hypothetical protein JM16_005975 [Phytophthora kernoviae]|uniref:Uncharacterized protein n=1 Tax=Phytophthora kernoviae TaxID=325452 RepID=A0A8T0LV12_9STRA|nr:hypothetical protein JM16_005975 [Phytophthora kernoviae]